MQHAYEKKGVIVPNVEQKVEFSLYHHLKTVKDDLEIFSTVARIPDAMLRKVDPSYPVMVAYLQTINPSIETGVLLPKGTGGPSKKQKGSMKEASKPIHVEKVVPVTLKKVVQSDPSPKKVAQLIIKDISIQPKDTMPSKSGVLKRLKKKVHQPCHSPDSSSSFLPKGVSHPKLTRKPQLNRKGVVIKFQLLLLLH